MRHFARGFDTEVWVFIFISIIIEILIDQMIFLRGSGEARAAQTPRALAVPRAPSHPLAYKPQPKG